MPEAQPAAVTTNMASKTNTSIFFISLPLELFSLNKGHSLSNHTISLHQSHPSAGENLSPPLGGGKIYSTQHIILFEGGMKSSLNKKTAGSSPAVDC